MASHLEDKEAAGWGDGHTVELQGERQGPRAVGMVQPQSSKDQGKRHGADSRLKISLGLPGRRAASEGAALCVQGAVSFKEQRNHSVEVQGQSAAKLQDDRCAKSACYPTRTSEQIVFYSHRRASACLIVVRETEVPAKRSK